MRVRLINEDKFAMIQNLKLLIISEAPTLVNKAKRSDITKNHDIQYLAPKEDVLALLETE